MANAAKYSSAFPVIVLSALQRNYDPGKWGISETALFRLWSVERILIDIGEADGFKAVCSVSQLVLLVLLGRGEGLGPYTFLFLS